MLYLSKSSSKNIKALCRKIATVAAKKCERPALEPVFGLSTLGTCRNTVDPLE